MKTSRLVLVSVVAAAALAGYPWVLGWLFIGNPDLAERRALFDTVLHEGRPVAAVTPAGLSGTVQTASLRGVDAGPCLRETAFVAVSDSMRRGSLTQAQVTHLCLFTVDDRQLGTARVVIRQTQWAHRIPEGGTTLPEALHASALTDALARLAP